MKSLSEDLFLFAIRTIARGGRGYRKRASFVREASQQVQKRRDGKALEGLDSDSSSRFLANMGKGSRGLRQPRCCGLFTSISPSPDFGLFSSPTPPVTALASTCFPNGCPAHVGFEEREDSTPRGSDGSSYESSCERGSERQMLDSLRFFVRKCVRLLALHSLPSTRQLHVLRASHAYRWHRTNASCVLSTALLCV